MYFHLNNVQADNCLLENGEAPGRYIYIQILISGSICQVGTWMGWEQMYFHLYDLQVDNSLLKNGLDLGSNLFPYFNF